MFRLAFLADFLPRSALIGFLTGVGAQVAGGELAGLIGLPKQGEGALAQIASAIDRMGSAHGATPAISGAVLALLIVSQRSSPRLPGALIAVVGAIVASAAFDFTGRDIATIGEVPSGLPSLSLPKLDAGEFHQVMACAASCFFVIVAQSAATARAYALRYEERFTDNSALVGLAGANAAAAVTGSFVVNGSPTKTEMLDEAGGRSRVAHLTTAVVVLLVLLLLIRPLGFLPSAVLFAIVFMIGIKLIDVKGMRELFRLQRNEFWIAHLTALTVVVFTVMDGIAVAVIQSLVDQVRRAYRPRTRVIVKDGEGHWQAVAARPDRVAVPGIVVYRFEANIFYANASLFMEVLLHLVLATREPGHTVLLDAFGMDDVDYTAAKMLLQLRAELAERGISIGLIAISDDVVDDLWRYGLASDKAEIYSTIDAAIAAHGKHEPKVEM
jgi:sulfate permease, SulP family